MKRLNKYKLKNDELESIITEQIEDIEKYEEDI